MLTIFSRWFFFTCVNIYIVSRIFGGLVNKWGTECLHSVLSLCHHRSNMKDLFHYGYSCIWNHCKITCFTGTDISSNHETEYRICGKLRWKFCDFRFVFTLNNSLNITFQITTCHKFSGTVKTIINHMVAGAPQCWIFQNCVIVIKTCFVCIFALTMQRNHTFRYI